MKRAWHVQARQKNMTIRLSLTLESEGLIKDESEMDFRYFEKDLYRFLFDQGFCPSQIKKVKR